MFVRVGMGLVVVALGWGCSGPPDKERHQAEGALAAALAAGAADYAPEQIAATEAALAAYDRAVTQGDYRQALHLAMEAREHAATAARRSGDEQALARSVAERSLADALSTLGDLQRQLDELTATEDAAMDQAARLQALLALGTARLQEARTAFEARDYRGVGRGLEAFLQELRTSADTSSTGG